jgi:hypothetical protein
MQRQTILSCLVCAVFISLSVVLNVRGQTESNVVGEVKSVTDDETIAYAYTLAAQTANQLFSSNFTNPAGSYSLVPGSISNLQSQVVAGMLYIFNAVYEVTNAGLTVTFLLYEYESF